MRVSILKPLCGLEPGLLENLLSFCHQDYRGEYELLLGVGNENDPAVEVVRQLQEDQSVHVPIRLMVAPPVGTSPKCSTITHLAQHARGDVLAISDSDIRVEPDYLRRLIQPLHDPGVGLISCLYKIKATPTCLAGLMESLYINFTLAPAIALSTFLPRARTGVGATLALRRSDLERIGGYAAVGDYAADDHQLAELIATLGLRTVLSDVLVEHAGSEEPLGQWWRREVRRGRTLRGIEPNRYLGLPLIFVWPWAIALVLLSGGAIWAWIALAATLGIQLTCGWIVAGRIGMPELRRRLLWLPLRSMVDAAVWAAAVMGRTIEWRGKTYFLQRDGKLVCQTKPNLPRRLIQWMDKRLRVLEGIFEFCDDPECMLRLQLRKAGQSTVLSDGTCIPAGSRYLELHFWNEHIPLVQPSGSDIAWGSMARRRMEKSLALLARSMVSRPEFCELQAVHATPVLLASPQRLARILCRFGFEMHPRPTHPSLLARLHERGEDILIWLLAWAFNPFDRNRHVLRRQRCDIWMSRQILLNRYGQAPQQRKISTHTIEPARASP